MGALYDPQLCAPVHPVHLNNHTGAALWQSLDRVQSEIQDSHCPSAATCTAHVRVSPPIPGPLPPPPAPNLTSATRLGKPMPGLPDPEQVSESEAAARTQHFDSSKCTFANAALCCPRLCAAIAT